uniref:Uncharacterized protein n=1 Tax=Chromera velia CCMP2878 TaxID=1169474 RepID=A0A0G4I0I7_9ALVE|eukprot:Cvel_1624.t1-p1 / transcript=Cvel_1624.t1 / gene=Cvel_1624 / organism=Chromera_velia_CCMP2878 / gene_product=Uncharacterized protein L426, putative / transcript_product=Uncharacterized protein L426, putative / location=Cvel_scaffold58:44954-45421(-) / protein_length=156 / sequence_SO=supercontig / SO=protein_coding / is_pseudo=false
MQTRNQRLSVRHFAPWNFVFDGYIVINVPKIPRVFPRHSGVAVEVVLLKVGFEIKERTTEVLLRALAWHHREAPLSKSSNTLCDDSALAFDQSIKGVFPVPESLSFVLSLPSCYKQRITLLTICTLTTDAIVFTDLRSPTFSAKPPNALVLTNSSS